MFQRLIVSAHGRLYKRIVGFVSSIAALTLQTALAGPVDTPSGAVLAEAKQIVKQMIDNPRGQYSRIRWYCNDGTILAPKPSACKDHGGGRQHAEYSSEHARLAELGWNVGTIFAPLTFEQLVASKGRYQRLRELALEKYLLDVDDGWVLRKAKSYRGRAQIEDEVESGRKILIDAVADSDWLNRNYLLIRELARVIPHDEDTDLSRKVRRAAIDLAEKDSSAEPLRAEIHSSPSALSAGRLRAWAAQAPNKTDQSARQLALSLADDIDTLYGEKGRRLRLNQQLSKLKSQPTKQWKSAVEMALAGDNALKMDRLCIASKKVRDSLLSEASKSDRLVLIDLLGNLETEVQLEFLSSSERIYNSRAAILNSSEALLNCVYGSGLISSGELLSAREAIEKATDNSVSIEQYINNIAQLKRILGWAASNVRYTFAEALVSYGALDSRAVRFTDDLLCGSPLWLMGDVLKVLSQDVANLSGSEVMIADKSVSSAIALNPGLARGTLRIFETLDAAENATPNPGDIVALPETIAELKPVAGILTLGEGNALSHVQLLARNFGIPNVAIDFSVIDLIKPYEGREVILVVSSDGNVVLRLADTVKDIDQLFPSKNKQNIDQKISVPPAQLSSQTFLPLAQIRRSLSGKVIGPKAANLGELNHLFPGKVAPALAIPFGIYYAQLSEAGIAKRIESVYASHSSGAISEQALNTELASIRAAINSLTLSPQMKSALVASMKNEFGESGSYGVFIRSDTNVEDLPQFTGAGLSETLANVTGSENIFNGIPQVWASVLSPRAIAWRSSLLTNPEKIYASVLVMKSVASEKSGVLVTGNLIDNTSPGLTVSTAWGVGGAVSGEAAEGIVILPSDQTILISEAKTPYQRQLNSSGGINWVAAPAGRVLNQSDIEQLRQLAAEVGEKYSPVYDEAGKQRPWDIEFGFVDGKLTLFQIRPLVEKNTQRADTVLRQLIAKKQASTSQLKANLSSIVNLSGRIGTPTAANEQ